MTESGPKTTDWEAAFWARVDKSGECWLWTGSRTVASYGSFSYQGRNVSAHRFLYERTIGPIPKGHCVGVRCRNKLCVRPDHFVAGPIREVEVNTCRLPTAERFWSKVERTERCWIWRGRSGDGVPRMDVAGSARNARRLAWEIQNGAIPPRKTVVPACGEPRCVRGDHLAVADWAPRTCLEVPTSERFRRNVRKTSTCWLWIGEFSEERHCGTFGVGDGRRSQAHRCAWELANGPIPRGMKVGRTCGNPRCVRPEHLAVGTQKEVQTLWTKGPWEKRFWRFVRKTRSCWHWLGATHMNGSGVFVPTNGRPRNAARLAYELTYGAPPTDKEVLHVCRTVSCVRPEHLTIGDGFDRARKMVLDGTHVAQSRPGHMARGERAGAAKLTQEQVDTIRREYRPRRVTAPMLAHRFGVSTGAIQAILSGRTWARPDTTGKRILAMAGRIRRLRAESRLSYVELSRRFRLPLSTIGQIVTGKGWKGPRVGSRAPEAI